MCYNTPMKNLPSPVARFSLCIFLLFGVVACSKTTPTGNPEYVAEIEEWRSARLERLTAEDGWLTLTGLYWLEPGDNPFGSNADNAIVLPDASVPAVAGRLVLASDGTVTAIAGSGARVSINDEPLAEATVRTDAQGDPDTLKAGRIQFYVIDREGRLGVRVKDPESPTRTDFAGIQSFPIDESFKIEARLEPYESPREVNVPTELGSDTTYLAPGVLHFTIAGQELTLEPFLSGPEHERYFLIFRDGTSGVTTYGAGRFLYAPAADESGMTLLDFNLAYNMPCAFTPYATCPLPPPQNWLQAPIEAGEKYP
jgi:uncharacterized protein (DUF1684 family)